MLHIVLWKWNQPNFRERYTAEHVNVVSDMVRKNLPETEHRVICITDDAHGIDSPTKTYPLWTDHDDLANCSGQNLPSCYRRLKLFDVNTQATLDIKPGERAAWIDLDSIVLHPIDDVFRAIEASKSTFAGWARRGTYHQQVYNGSFVSFRAGDNQHVWSNFDAKRSPREALKAGFLGSDQAWLSFLFARDPKSFAIRFPIFSSYPQEVRRTRVLDRRTKVVFFHGARKPWHPQEQQEQPWVKQHWRMHGCKSMSFA